MAGWFSSKEKPSHASPIEDYAIIGDLETSALVSHDGSIDWLCWPSLASSACFAALLGTAENGFWRIHPKEKIVEVRRRYIPDTMILETTFITEDGEVCLTDFMPPRREHSHVVRQIKGIRGKVRMRMDLVIRFDYGMTIPWVTFVDEELRAVAGPDMVVLRSRCMKGEAAKLRGEDLSTVAEFTLREGDENCFVLTYGNSFQEIPKAVSVEKELESTRKFWCDWSAKSEYRGDYKDAVQRSLMALKAMTYAPTGGMAAAVTTSLPEAVGGERNWDYRYCWLRDTSFALLLLMRAGYEEEALHWRGWLLRAIAGSSDQVQSVYGLSGERRLPEWTVGWLRGYEKSSPVRIGNAAADQFQLDVYGEVALALNRSPQVNDDVRTPAADLEGTLIDRVCEIWNMPDEGIWETRGGRKHFVHSKVMAWVALDRGIQNHERYDGKGDLKRWKKNRDMLHKEICEKGFDNRLNSFVQSYGSKEIDASLLRILFVGFLPLDDPRILGTVAAVEKHLLEGDFVQRYNVKASPDGLKGSEGAFLACSFWLVTAYHVIGRKEEARAMFERLLKIQNDVGLFAEEYDPVKKRMLGNFPQALTHISLAHAALAISGQWEPTLGQQPA